MDANINNRIQQIEERISGAEDYVESIDSTVKKCKMKKKKACNKNHQGNQGQNEKTKPKDYSYRIE